MSHVRFEKYLGLSSEDFGKRKGKVTPEYVVFIKRKDPGLAHFHITAECQRVLQACKTEQC